MKPRLKLVDFGRPMWSCRSLTPVGIFGMGTTPAEAYRAWLESLADWYATPSSWHVRQLGAPCFPSTCSVQ